MNLEQVIARFEAIEARLDKLEGKEVEQGPKRAPASPVRFRKSEENEWPKWMLVDGEEVLVKDANSIPDGAVEVGAADEDQAQIEPEELAVKPVSEGDIPEDWKSLHHFKRIALAKTLPGGEEVVSADDADAVIELELERRADAS